MAEDKDDTFEPGAAPFGNFINYYDFNPPGNRLKLLQGQFCEFFNDSHFPEELCLLDVGSNSGELTRGIVDLLSSSRKGASAHMLGIDLDPQLVERAVEKCSSPTVEFRRLNAVTDVQEREALWSSYLAARGRKRFHIAFCFSTTMWVHLNHGDSGLESLLASLCQWADNVVIEPQPWKCYRSAARRLRRAGKPPFPHFDSLVHRSSVLDHIDHVMRHQLSMVLHAHLGDSEWLRPVRWYRHVTSS